MPRTLLNIKLNAHTPEVVFLYQRTQIVAHERLADRVSALEGKPRLDK